MHDALQAARDAGIDIPTLCETGKIVRVSDAGVREAHPHDIKIMREAPNYRS